MGLTFELESPVAGSDGNCERVYTGAGNEFLNLSGIGEGGIGIGHIDGVLNTGQATQLSLHNHTAVMGIIGHFFGQSNVVLKIEVGTVDHDGRKAAIHAALAKFEAVAVIQMKHNGKAGLLNSRFHHFYKIGVIGVLAGASADLQDDGSVLFLGRFGDGLDDFHVVHVEGAYGISALISFLEHLFRGYQRHEISSFFAFAVNPSIKQALTF